MRLVTALLLAVAGWGAYGAFSSREIKHPPGQVAPDAPIQRNLENSKSFVVNDFTLTPRASFSGRVRVLRTERYRFYDQLASISPIDVAIGWGPMSDSVLIDQLSLAQSGRFLYWRSSTPLHISWSDINRSASHMHVIPSSNVVLQKLKRLRAGELVDIEGELVDVKYGRQTWNTSLSRDDTGAGACEIVFLHDVVVRK
jgi:hypothetical protein